jgi:hypothetical protein
MAKYLQALEEGDLKALPTPFYARAFALAYARACGADEEEAIERVSTAFSSAPRTALASDLKRDAAEATPAISRESSSPRFGGRRILDGPWRLWAIVALGSVAFLFLLNALVTSIRSAAVPVVPTPVAAVATPLAESSTAQVVGEALDLRSRRPCWVVLEIDGKRLPTIFLEPDKRERWTVNQKAVMLAGNIGAVRVWWQGENLGYFGELGERMNGIVFENGKPWRKDPASELALPPGVPSQAPH